MFTSATGYKLIKKEIGLFLQQHDFLPYKSETFYRITPGDILQFLSFQKGVQSLQDQMTINVAIQGLFSPTCSFLVLQPGGRIGQFLALSKDKWWHCDSEKVTLESITDIKENLAVTLLPDLQQKMSFSEQLIDTFNSTTYRFLWQGQGTFIDQGYTCLKARRYNEGLTIFRANSPGKVAKLAKFMPESRR